MRSISIQAGLVSCLIFVVFIAIWYAATLPSSGMGNAAAQLTAEQLEYAKMMGKAPGSQKTTWSPTPAQMAMLVGGLDWTMVCPPQIRRPTKSG